MIDQEINCQHLTSTSLSAQPIAILVTNQNKQNNDNCLIIAPQVLLDRKGIHRSKQQHHRKVRTHQQIRSHSLQKEEPSAVKRTRRISSSTAAKRFPKDFFNIQPKSKPSKPPKDNHNQFPNLVDTFSHQFLVFRSQQEQSRKSQPSNSQQTPQFRRKQATKQIHSGGYLGDRYANSHFLAKINRFIALKENLCIFRRAEDKGQATNNQIKNNQILKEASGKNNNMAVPLGEKVKRVLVMRRQKEKNLLKRETNFGNLQITSKDNPSEHGFRIRKNGGL